MNRMIKQLLFLVLCVILFSCRDKNLYGKYEIFDTSKQEERVLKSLLDSMSYLRTNKGNQTLELFENQFVLKNHFNKKENFGNWYKEKDTVFLVLNDSITLKFLSVKNNLISINKVVLCKDKQSRQNVTFFTKTQ